MTGAPPMTGPLAADAGPAGPTAQLAVPFSTRLAARLDRLRHWEFWPAAAVYAPLLPHILWLAVRHRSLTVCTLCNPAIPLGGIVGESKSAILRLLPAGPTLPHVLVPPGPLAQRLGVATEAVLRVSPAAGAEWPVVVKPDVGQRGTGVRLIASPAELGVALAVCPRAVIVQRYHPGPFEAGVFYVRQPGERRGRIFSITDKVFPEVVGDGRSTLASLVWAHQRYRAQAGAHLANLGPRASAIPAAGERVRLGFAGNHARGTLFLDGAHLITPALAEAFDAIADAVAPPGGLHFGRFDVRYADAELFKLGRDLHIVEFNGLLSESTNIYDPGTGFWAAQRVLRRQWSLAYATGAAVRRDRRGR